MRPELLAEDMENALVETLRHESGHGWLKPGEFLHQPRAELAKYLYRRSHMCKYLSEWGAEAYATRSVKAANALVRHPAYGLNIGRAWFEIGAYGATVGGASHTAHSYSETWLDAYSKSHPEF